VFRCFLGCARAADLLCISRSVYTQMLNHSISFVDFHISLRFYARQFSIVLHSLSVIFNSVNYYLGTVSTRPTIITTLKLTS